MLSIFTKDLWTKELVAWYLYDLANSFVTINITLYFSQWVVVDQGLSDFWFSLSFVIPTFILIFLSTYVGSVGDRNGTHASIFIKTTIGTLLSVILILLGGRFLYGVMGVATVLVFYALYQFFVQLSLVPYYAFIKHISKEEIYGKVSGIGFAFSQIGNIAGLLLTLPIINGSIDIFGNDRLAPLVPALIAFSLLFLPSYFVFRKKKFLATGDSDRSVTKLSPLPSFWKAFVVNMKDSRKYPGVFPLLLAFYLFSDAMATITVFSAIYLQNVFEIGDAAKVNIFLMILIGFGIGALAGGIISDRYKPKPTLTISLFVNAITIFVVALNQSPEALSLIFAVFGFTMGFVYAVSRSYLASLVPTAESGTFFGLYTFAEKFASVIGPLIWGIIIFLFQNSFPTNYRIAAFAMGILVLLGVVPLIWKSKRFLSSTRF